MKILITGCNGQLGNEMQLLAKKNPQHQYFFTDVEELDITDAEAIDRFVQDNQVDCIVNCAAYTAVDKAEENEEFCNLLNNIAPGYLAKAIEKRGGYMVQVSTDYVFDGTNHTPYTEEEPTCPNSVYGRTKLAGEKQVLENCKQSMIIRTAWLYSTFGNNFVKTMIRLGQTKPELGVIFDQIGTPTYARDLAAAIFAAINQGIVPGIYHFSNEGVISWYDFTSLASTTAKCVRSTLRNIQLLLLVLTTLCWTRPKSRKLTASKFLTGKKASGTASVPSTHRIETIIEFLSRI